MLFTWDGTSDTVTDLDYVFYGSASSSARNREMDKTGDSVDGPDSGSTPTSYLPDTDGAQQRKAPKPSGGDKAVQRIEFTELGESRAAGNGVGGHDETSEPVDTTFIVGPPTPGFP